MEIKLTITSILPLETGAKQNGGTWRKQSFIGDTSDKYPRKVMFSAFNDTIDKISVTQGKTYNVSFDISSRSFVGKDGKERWSTDITAWKIEECTNEPSAMPQYAAPAQQQFQAQASHQQYQAPAQPQYQAPVPPQQPMAQNYGGQQAGYYPQQQMPPQQPSPTNDLPF